MKPYTQFHPFGPEPSWYDAYWLTERTDKPRKVWSRRLPVVIAAEFGKLLRAHMAAAAQARRLRMSLDES